MTKKLITNKENKIEEKTLKICLARKPK